MRKVLCRNALALIVLGGSALATSPVFARGYYVGPDPVAPPAVAVDPYPPVVIVEPVVPLAPPVVPVAPPVVGYAAPYEELVPVAPEAEFDYGPPVGPAIEVGGD
jgi:hypothetical protein